MIPILYDKTGNVKLGELTNCIECLAEEERNGLFEVSLIYPTNDTLFNSLEEENIIVCNANDTLLNQKFRIYMTRKLMSNRVEVFARHISFDLAYDYINNIDIKNQSCEYALNTIFRNSQFSTHYKGYSDIINAQNYKISKVNCIEAIGGTRGSVIDTFGTGAEILRDNTNIHVLNKRGHDNGVTIEYAKNLTGFELEEDYSELITRIIPFATYTDSETSEEVLVEANQVDSDLISNYSHPYISYMDFSEKFGDEEIPTTSKLTELAKKYFKDNNCDKPKQNFKIEFIPLSKCVGYEGIQDNISLCDTVTIKDTRFNIDTKAKVIKTVFNVLKNKYESMELGEPRTTLGDIINSSGGSGESGEQGPPGPQGPPGQDGSIGDFPNTLPSTPILSANVYGFANIELSWTYENKVYYNYEVYGSKTKDFKPNTFDLIHAGQSSSFLFQAKPNETWYFRVCAVNTHGERTPFSSQVTVNTVKIDDLSNYVENMAISDALIGTLSLDRGWYGELRGNYIDAKQLSVTDGNGKRTLDIDSFGNVNLDVAKLSIKSEAVSTENFVNAKIQLINNEIKLHVKEDELDSLIQQKSNSVKIAFNNISSEWEFTDDRLTNKQSGNKSLSLYHGRLNTYSFQNGSFTGFLGSSTSLDSESSKWRDGVTVSTTGNAHYINFGHRPTCYSDSNVTEGDFSPILTLVTAPHNNLERGIYAGGNLYMPYGRYLDCDEHVTANGFKGKTNTTLFYNAGTGASGGGIQMSVDGITYFNPQWNNGVSLGSGSNRYRYIYLTNAPYVSSDSRLKEDITYIDKDNEAIFTSKEVYNFFKNTYKPVTYKFKERNDNETKIGFIAQDLLYDKIGSYLISMNETMPNSTNPDDLPNLSYSQGNLEGLIAIALKEEIRKRDKQIESLEKENENLKSRLDNIEKILSIIESRCING